MTQEMLALISGGGGACILKAIELSAKLIRAKKKDSGDRSAASLAARANIDIALIKDGAEFRRDLLAAVKDNEARVTALQGELKECNRLHVETQTLMGQREREHESLKRDHQFLSQQHGELTLRCKALEAEVEQLRQFSMGLKMKDNLVGPLNP
ncbi:MAG TPA: hypothetical protein VJX67_06340 [Blastocatellia bacterium]|nr:hypothetical protein [Blastocatellia bacterium]